LIVCFLIATGLTKLSWNNSGLIYLNRVGVHGDSESLSHPL